MLASGKVEWVHPEHLRRRGADNSRREVCVPTPPVGNGARRQRVFCVPGDCAGRLAPPATRQFTRHTMPSKFRRISNKTNVWCPRQVIHKLRRGARPSVRRLGGRSFSSDIPVASAVRSLLPQAVAQAAWSQRPAFLIDTPAIRDAPNTNHPSAAPISNRHGSGGANRATIAPNYSTHVPSNFRSNSLKTNNWCTREVTLKSGRSERFAERGFTPAVNDAVASLPFAPLHLREFPGASLTNHRSLLTNHPVASLLSSADALRIIFRCMIVVLNKRIFFQPGAPRWASLFSEPKTSCPSHSYTAFRREND